jgi:hypothetical protein
MPDMVKLINPATKTETWVADDRIEEYKAAGYKLAANLNPEKPTETKKRTVKK